MCVAMLSVDVCLADCDELGDAVSAIASTNTLETWEGQYVFCGAFPISSVSNTNSLCLCLYTTSCAEGTLLEIYERTPSCVRKVLSADANVKGVTPVVLQFGTSTNKTDESYWSRWRHPGNGGGFSHVYYSRTNGTLSVAAHYEYCDMGYGKRWHAVSGEDSYVAATNMDFSADVLLWSNTNTLYSVLNN